MTTTIEHLGTTPGLAVRKSQPGALSAIDQIAMAEELAAAMARIAELEAYSSIRTDELLAAVRRIAELESLADEFMCSQLECHAMRLDEHGIMWGLHDGNGNEVDTLAEAEPAIQEAIEWLQARGIAEVIEGRDGDEIILLKEAAE